MLNIVATYGRSLYALVCGLFISRWVLAALGKTDFDDSASSYHFTAVKPLLSSLRPRHFVRDLENGKVQFDRRLRRLSRKVVAD